MTTVFLNGCFDCFHVGHLRLLQFAKSFVVDKDNDRLVVAINSDESVRAAKGPGRPIIPEQQRMEMLYGFGAESVIIYDEPTPIEVVKDVRPDVLVVSSQYATTCESCRHVRSYNGRVVQAPDCGDVTTSKIVARICGEVLQ